MTARRWAAIAAGLLAVLPVVPVRAAPGDPNWVCGAYDQSAKRGRNPAPDGAGHTFPVVTIHGITGSDDDFDRTIDKSYIGANPQPPRTLLDAFAGPKTPGATLPPGLNHMRVYSFSYTPDSLRWVDHPNVGEKFAATIDCLYQRHGVPVSVVAHSMGGLVTRWVANTSDPAGVARASKLGKVVTLGTPYEGSALAAVANGVTDVLGAARPAVSILNYLCGEIGTHTGKGSCGWIPLYSSLRSEAGRNLRAGSSALARLARWPAGVDVSTLAGSERVPLALFGSPLNTAVDLGDVVVATASATADPRAGRVFECRYDSASATIRTRFKEILRIADPLERRRKLGGAFMASPCYHGNLMGYVELTNEVLGLLTEWTTAHKAPDIRSIDLRNTTWPADSCEVDGWASSPPIPVRNGEGSAGNRLEELPNGHFYFAELYYPETLGYVDLDGNGSEEAVTSVRCTNGGAYGDQLVVVLTMDRGRLVLFGGTNLSAVSTRPEHLNLVDDFGERLSRIDDARLEGRDIVVTETYDATGRECNACHTGRATVRWRWNGRWTATLQR